MNFKANESQVKLRGAYYTPSRIANFVARWVLEKNPRTILEPSSGDGAFFEALQEVASAKGRRGMQVDGVDIDLAACGTISQRIKHGDFPNLRATVTRQDFLTYSLKLGRRYDAVIGNPPFIRYQYVEPEYQALTEKIFEQNGLAFSKHTNAWVPFLIQGLQMLNPGGRLGMVIPAELMHVLHAKSTRDFITQACSRVHVIHIPDLFSASVLQGVVLLFCEHKRDDEKGAALISFPELRLSQLTADDPAKELAAAPVWKGTEFDRKWMEGLLTQTELHTYRAVANLAQIRRFSDIAMVDVGIVTGANDFFLVPDEVVSEYSLKQFVRPMFGRSTHVRGVIFSASDHADNRKGGLPANFVNLPRKAPRSLPPRVRDYIRLGERQGLHRRFKCRIRNPWYSVPSVWASEVSMLKRAHGMPRLILNRAAAFTTDTAYRIRMHEAFRQQQDAFVGGFVNSLTALSAELEGRHYGGGVIELVPSEIERLLVPITAHGQGQLKSLDLAFRSGRPLEEILATQNRKILRAAGLSSSEIEIIHRAWMRLMRRRLRHSNQSEE